MPDASDRPVIDPARGPEMPSELRPQGMSVTMGADIRVIDGMLKVAHARKFEFYCDEPFGGGEDRYPQPLHYVAAGVGF